MKKIILASSLILGLAAVLPFSSFRSGPTDAGARALAGVQQYFHSQLDEYTLVLARFNTQAEAYQKQELSLEALRTAHLDTRLAFKKVEFLLEYNDPSAVKKFLNGPPLPSLEPAVPEVRILDPHGLQVIDELLFASETIDETELNAQLTALVKASQQLISYQKNLKLQHRHILEATRLELVRIFTLGLTGFDTPGSLHVIPEAEAALGSLYFALQQYTPLLTERAPDLLTPLNQLFPAALAVLGAHPSFEEFDRLAFLREFINPMSDLVWQIQNRLGVETMQEVTAIPQSLSLGRAPLFSEGFFNPTYYRGFGSDPLMDKKMELGRLLFYDPILSANNERACASCHRPELAFTDGRPKSLAYDGEKSIQRNAPTLLNSVFTERFFYDLRESELERQIKHVVMDAHEFSTDFITIIEKLGKSHTYQDLFAQAYPTAGLGKYSISNALGAYVAELTSFNSPFDQYARGESPVLPEEVIRGFNLFMGKAACGTCHFAPTFSWLVPPYYQESESEVLGVPVLPDSSQIDPDLGRFNSGRPIDEAPFYQFSFKTTTVRNAALTAPYMHNGAFPDLTSVINFYNHGGGAGLGIELMYQTLAPDSLGLTHTEINAVVAFMNSLTDTSKVGTAPRQLPPFEAHPEWNKRPVGGSY